MSRRAPGLWWLSPAGAVLLVVAPTLLLTQYLDDAEFQLFYRTAKVVTPAVLLLVATAALVVVVTATVVGELLPSRPGARQLLPGGRVPPLLHRATQPLFWLTMAGYAAFAVAGAARGVTLSDLVQVVASQDSYAGSLKDEFAGVAGLTTLTQVGIAFVVVATYVLLHQRDRRLVAQVVLVLALTLVRSYVNSERLALIEVVVPALAVVAMTARRGGPAQRAAARLAPVVLLPLLLVVFAVFEYSRSWQFFADRTEQPFPVFAALRLVGYYATAYNNGQLHLEHSTYPGRLPQDSLAAFWEAPGIAQLQLYERLSAPPPAAATRALQDFGNPEFNNPGGLTTPFVDFGLVGGFVALAVLGVALGLLARGFRDGTVVGALLYPVAVTGLLDLPRYLYWTQGRVVPAVAALLVVAAVLRRSRAPAAVAVPARRRRPQTVAARS